MIDIYEAMSNRTIYIEKDLDGRRWYITDNVTDVVGKGLTRTAALACYNRGIELWQMKQAGYDITDWDRFHEDCLEGESEMDNKNVIRVKGKMKDINNLLVGSPIKYNDKIIGIVESINGEDLTFTGTVDKDQWESFTGNMSIGLSVELSRE